jgi:uncharacterized protein (TIGR02611 family)
MGGTTDVDDRTTQTRDATGPGGPAHNPEAIHPLVTKALAHPLTRKVIRGGELFRDRLHHPMRNHPVFGLPYRVLVATVGTFLVLIGLVMVPAPGPGWLVVITGLAVLAGEFVWARRLLHFTRDKLAAWTRWGLRQPLAVRAGFGLLGFVTLIASLLVSLKMSGWNGFPFG